MVEKRCRCASMGCECAMMGTFLLWLIGAAIALAVGIAAGWLTAGSVRERQTDWTPARHHLHRQLRELIVKVEQFVDTAETPGPTEVAEWAADLHSMAGTFADGAGASANSKPPITASQSAKTSAASVEEAPPETPSDKRSAERRKFDSEQLIAQYNGRRIPKAWSFRLHKCRDVSTSGLSFYSDQRMASEFVIVRLGNAIEAKFVVGSIVRTTRARLPDGDMFCIACKFDEVLEHHRVSDALRIQLNALLERENDLINAPLCKTVSSKS
jgi:hypothetical protein